MSEPDVAAEGPRRKGRPIDPRFRRRWAEARREEGRRRLRVVLAGLALVALLALAVGLVYSPLFNVRHVVVVGDVHTPRAQVLAAAGLSGTSGSVRMLDAGSAREVRAVEALPWVASASFGRRWPWTVVVTVKERSPVAVVAAGRGEAVVDVTGRAWRLARAERRPGFAGRDRSRSGCGRWASLGGARAEPRRARRPARGGGVSAAMARRTRCRTECRP